MRNNNQGEDILWKAICNHGHYKNYKRKKNSTKSDLKNEKDKNNYIHLRTFINTVYKYMINKYMPMIVKINIKNKNNKTKTLKLLYSFYYYNNIFVDPRLSRGILSLSS
ncbi:hypothetical protein PFLG_02216 [Plasmodium falciparum RAJ116]|uniref:Uncharacterized protein n=1 Tax=Plasmodium falciparum RAJ116 TaxID=580058 RepID=A0A0L0CYY2_PLAFA|nr:hypothetical protein PFLG_02216 [Plasmodium falciparum RAJ116]